MAKISSLHESDFLLWTEETVNKLKALDFQHLDLPNLIEEVEALGISQKKELLSRLTTLLEHLLKRLYVTMPQEYNGWERTIREQRKEIDLLLVQMPSLRRFWDEDMQIAWKSAIKVVRKEYRQTAFPEQWQYSIQPEAILDYDFWEEN
ncbi:DUF29 domain-containing protein [Cronbergia sp. UHCC 0137]|uniref:DUF29 domain-containing protein n=1 Tax=Cronbergia sp. UHCC 0137 TaxID=3110239 RepID=UPI002B205858|nr:DUF29 domain-containing protein [Cronbergia sp. UHCC 0137]MEA5619887.1 DUF29 domain-containing protein [Cronbergia sp. UHCC 0137]